MKRALAIAALLAAISVHPAAINNAVPVLTGLNGPRGVAPGPAGRLIFGESDGSISEMLARGHNAGTKRVLQSVPATFIAPAVATRGGQIFVLTAQGAPGSGSNTLYRVNNGRTRALADIAAYQMTDPDPFNVTLDPEESNPFGVAALGDGSVLVADAAGNDLLRVYPNGDIGTVARLMPRLVASPGGPGLPPAGTMILSEAVATSVTVGADGYYYVGELRGFPATPGTSQIWRIAPNSVGAVCNPDAPNAGACQRYKDGFTSIVDLEAGDDGSLYVVELSKQSWLAMEMGVAGAEIGGVFRIAAGGAVSELAPGELIRPAGIAVVGDAVYVSGPVFGPGALMRVQ